MMYLESHLGKRYISIMIWLYTSLKKYIFWSCWSKKAHEFSWSRSLAVTCRCLYFVRGEKLISLFKRKTTDTSNGERYCCNFATAYPEKCKSLIPIGPWVGGYGVNDFKSPAADSVLHAMRTVTAIAKDKGPKEATDYFWTGNKVFRSAVRSSNALDHLKMVGYDYSYWDFWMRLQNTTLTFSTFQSWRHVSGTPSNC